MARGVEGVAAAVPTVQLGPRWLPRPDLLGWVIPGGIVAVWYLIFRLEVLPPVLVPSPVVVLRTLIEWIAGAPGVRTNFYAGRAAPDLAASLARIAIGFSAGSLVAILAGTLAGWSERVARYVDPLIQVLRPIPRTAFFPFTLLLFGLSQTSAIVLIAYGSFIAAYVQVLSGVRLVSRDLKRAAYMLGASDLTVLRRVVFPAALPYVFGGLRVGIAYAWALLLLAEMFATKSGIGYTLWRSFEFMRMDVLLATLVMLGLCGAATDRLIVLTSQRVLDWAQDIAETRL